MSSKKQDPRVDKRRVTMTTYVPVITDDGPEMQKHEAVDYVRPDFLDAYVAEAQTRWQSVVVSDEPDAGPGGYDGQTHISPNLNHPDAGTTYAAANQEEAE